MLGATVDVVAARTARVVICVKDPLSTVPDRRHLLPRTFVPGTQLNLRGGR